MKIFWLQIYVLPRKSEDIDIIRHFYLSLTFLIKNISDHLSEVTSIQGVTVIGLVSSFLLLFYWFLGPFTALMMSYVIPSSLFSVFVDFPRLQVLHLYKCIPDFISWLFLNISQWKDEGSIQPSWFLQRPPPPTAALIFYGSIFIDMSVTLSLSYDDIILFSQCCYHHEADDSVLILAAVVWTTTWNGATMSSWGLLLIVLLSMSGESSPTQQCSAVSPATYCSIG